MTENKASIISYDGVCPICGSMDGIIQLDPDGKYRNICRHFNCYARYSPAPAVGFESEDDCRHPFDTEYLKGEISVGEYLGKKRPHKREEAQE